MQVKTPLGPYISQAPSGDAQLPLGPYLNGQEASPVELSLAVTEASDTASFTVTEVLVLSVTEAPDTASFTVTEVLVLAVTEDPDTASFSLELDVRANRGGGVSAPRPRKPTKPQKKFELPYYIELVEEVKTSPNLYDEEKFKEAARSLRTLLKETEEVLAKQQIEELLNHIKAIIRTAQQHAIEEAKRLDVQRNHNRTIVLLYMEQRRRRLRNLL